MSILSKQQSRVSTNFDRFIDLTDNTRSPRDTGSEQGEVVANILQKTTSRISNPSKLREDRYNSVHAGEDDAVSGIDLHSSTTNLVPSGAFKSSNEDSNSLALKKTYTGGGRLRRGQQKVKGLLSSRRKPSPYQDRGVEIDILYENQRGSWFLGIPLFSSKSLLNFDPSSWTNAYNKPSLVSVTNAQLPDPSWEWAWKSWYVDMSLDVDEQGWEYSFMFQTKFAWHGTHPWFHSFVRRRRWVRKRVRRHKETILGQLDCVHEEHHTTSHKLNADYFSVHPAGVERRKSGSTYDLTLSGVLSTDQTLVSDGPRGYDDELDDISTLLQRLKWATVDREKIKLVLDYMDRGGEDTHYLADQIPHIMSFLIFQDSRRQLVARMLVKVDERQKISAPLTAVSLREKETATEKGKQKSSHPAESNDTIAHDHQPLAANVDHNDERELRKTANLLRAVEAGHRELKHLEYWSDLRDTSDGPDLRGG